MVGSRLGLDKDMCSQLHWSRGFNEVTSPSGIFYQSWANGVATVNLGANGLQHFGKATF